MTCQLILTDCNCQELETTKNRTRSDRTLQSISQNTLEVDGTRGFLPATPLQESVITYPWWYDIAVDVTRWRRHWNTVVIFKHGHAHIFQETRCTLCIDIPHSAHSTEAMFQARLSLSANIEIYHSFGTWSIHAYKINDFRHQQY